MYLKADELCPKLVPERGVGEMWSRHRSRLVTPNRLKARVQNTFLLLTQSDLTRQQATALLVALDAAVQVRASDVVIRAASDGVFRAASDGVVQAWTLSALPILEGCHRHHALQYLPPRLRYCCRAWVVGEQTVSSSTQYNSRSNADEACQLLCKRSGCSRGTVTRCVCRLPLGVLIGLERESR